MANTPNLALPYIDQNQSQKHVTHNVAIRELDAIVQLSVLDDALTAPPATPADGDRYIVATGGSAAWLGKDGEVAAWQDGAWNFYAPKSGWLAFVVARSEAHLYAGAAWVPLASAIGALVNLAGLGILTAADATNRLAVKSDAALFTHDDVTPGTGDMRFVLNKKTAAHTVSQLYQSNWSGRAETGLTGDDHFRVKVSADGSTWKEAIDVDPATGKYSSPSGRIHAATGKDIADFVFTPGGDGQVSFYRMDRTSRFKNPRTAVVSSVSGDTITLTTASADLFFNAIMAGVSYVRIWNVSKTPNHSAWVKAIPNTSNLQVLSASDISGWANGETVQIGDPTSVTPNRVIAIDISQMLQNVLGAVFPQKAVLMKLSIGAAGSSGGLGASPTGASGSFIGLSMPTDGATVGGQIIVPCSVLSPVSNSNLVFLREDVVTDGTLGITLASSSAVFV